MCRFLRRLAAAPWADLMTEACEEAGLGGRWWVTGGETTGWLGVYVVEPAGGRACGGSTSDLVRRRPWPAQGDLPVAALFGGSDGGAGSI